jgi:hypothetical protein
MSRTSTFDCEDVELPTRYLEIMRDRNNASDQSKLRFALRESRGRRGSYIALSHRWTEASEDAMTTKENYLCRTGDCSHDSPCSTWDRGALNELFSEASLLAVNLGIDKIWIDSICIIQNDPSDWKIESVRMAEYYQFAWLTIAATQRTTSGGLRGESRPTDIPRLARLPYRNSRGQQHGYFYLQAADPEAIAGDYRENVSNSDLLKRGWVCQEWHLSRRILSFSSAGWGIFMQCKNGENPKTWKGDHILIQAGLDVGNAMNRDLQLSWSLDVDNAMNRDLQLSWSDRAEIFLAWRDTMNIFRS